MGLALFSMVIIPFQIIAFIVIDRNSENSFREHQSLTPFVWETVENKKIVQENNAKKAFENNYQEKISGMTNKATFKGVFQGLGIGIFFFVLFAFSAGIFLLICKIIINRPNWWSWDYFILPKEPIMVFIATMLSSLYLSWIRPSWLSIKASVKAANKIDSLTKNYDREDGFKRITGLQGKVEFKNVYFKQLKNLSFVAQPGQSVGILADKVSEKGAIADLIAGFYYCESGSVLVDGLSIKEYLINDLREFVSVVPQNPMILHKSFRDNICLGSIYSDEDIEKAAKLTNVHDLIMSKGGYSAKTENLSLLEKQKISLTRVILRDPKVLVIDSIYSVFDAKNREEYSKIIEKCIKKRTSIVISEYPSVINFVENMIILSSGTVIDSGKFDEISQNPKIIALQKAESSSMNLKSPENNPQTPLTTYKTFEFLLRVLSLDSKL